jgi:hypothetical protein
VVDRLIELSGVSMTTWFETRGVAALLTMRVSGLIKKW